MIDALECRVLLAILNITGTTSDDEITLTQNGDQLTVQNFGVNPISAGVSTNFQLANNQSKNFSISQLAIGLITVDLKEGNDRFNAFDAGNVNIAMKITAGPETVPANVFDNDIVRGGAKNNVILGGAGDDSLTGGAAGDSILGGSGADVIDGGSGNDTIRGGTGNDGLVGGPGRDSIFGDENDDFIKNADGAVDSINGGTGFDRAESNSEHDFFVPNTVEDTQNALVNIGRHAGNSPDFLGTNGDDVMSLSASGDLITYTLNGHSITLPFSVLQAESQTVPNGGGTGLYYFSVFGLKGNDKITIDSTNITNLNGPNQPISVYVVGAGGNDTLISTAGGDLLYGESGDDLMVNGSAMTGGSGNDTMVSSGANDSLDGYFGLNSSGIAIFENDSSPDGIDIIDLSSHTEDLTVNLNLSSFAVTGGNVSIDAIDGVIGGSGNDSLIGNDADNILVGGPGNDSLFGQNGNDSLIPNAGNDSVVGGDGVDEASLADFTAPVKVTLDDVANDGAAGETKNIRPDIEKVTGGSGDDSITGDDNPQTLVGGAGKDSLIGLGGNDSLVGGLGDDSLVGGADNDSLTGGDGANALVDTEGTNTFHVSGFTPVSATNGSGPLERDLSNNTSAAGDGHTLKLNGKSYFAGLGTHSNSVLVYNLGGLYSQFLADIGIDDEVGSDGNVIFQAFVDGQAAPIYDSGVMTGSSSTRSISFDVTGKNTLTLKVLSNGSTSRDHADWADARLIDAPPSIPFSPYLSDLTPTSAANGWGKFERDRSNGDLGSSDGKVIRLGGIAYQKGLGVHADSDLVYQLGGNYTHFTADIGIDDEVGNNGNVIFRVLADGVQINPDIQMTGASPTQHLDIDVTNAINLELVVLKNGSKDYDHADWANARVWVDTPPPPTPGGTFISDLTPQSETNGWGPAERDRSNNEKSAGDGHILSIGGVTYDKGMGVHANSSLIYDIQGMGFTQFAADIGIDDEVGNKGSVLFFVKDGSDNILWQSDTEATGADIAQHIVVDVTGIGTLKLVVTDGFDFTGHNIDYDHADWADAKLT